MTRSVAIPGLGAEFEDFLFAPVGDEKNGMSLSVLSALARLGVDPWQEAANLARLPEGSALERLTSLIAALPGGTLARPDPHGIAARLIGLLPHGVASTVVARAASPGVGAVIGSPGFARMVVLNLLLVAVMLGAHMIAASRQPPTAQAGDNPAATPAAESSQPSPPNAGQ